MLQKFENFVPRRVDDRLKNLLIIDYCKDGQAYGDAICEEKLMEAYKQALTGSKDITIKTSTDNIVLAVRALIVRDSIVFDNVRIKFEGQPIPMDGEKKLFKNTGNTDKVGIHNWPDGFCDYSKNWLNEIFGI